LVGNPRNFILTRNYWTEEANAHASRNREYVAGQRRQCETKVAEGITKVFEKENIPSDAVTVIMHEIPKSDWARAGKLCSD
jgi:phenylpyruvate tautomerase PptA (4-oxalocrotonate tautomerase family)